MGGFSLLERAAATETYELWRARALDRRQVRGLERLVSSRAREAAFAHRYFAQAQRSLGLEHPNLVTVLEVARDRRGPWVIEEWVEGITLGALVADAVEIPPWLALELVLEVTRALAHAHTAPEREPLVHGALTPDDVRLGWDGAIKVARIGRSVVGPTGLSGRSTDPILHRHLPSLSPEHISGEALSERSDVYGVALLLHELLTGERVFRRSSDLMTARAIMEDAAPPLAAKCPGAPEALNGVLGRALFKHPEDRWPSASSLAAALADIQSEGPPVDRSTVAAFLAARREGHPERFDRAPFRFLEPTARARSVPRTADAPPPRPRARRTRRRPLVFAVIGLVTGVWALWALLR